MTRKTYLEDIPLEDALSRSLDLAAAMDSRGYGFSRRRSKYRPNSWRISEYVLCIGALIAIAFPVTAFPAALLALLIVPSQKMASSEILARV